MPCGGKYFSVFHAPTLAKFVSSEIDLSPETDTHTEIRDFLRQARETFNIYCCLISRLMSMSVLLHYIMFAENPQEI